MSEGKVLGIGGVFIRSPDPARLAAWYYEKLGVAATEAGKAAPDGSYTWMQEAGETSFSIFRSDNDYFEGDRQVMLNFRVSGLDALLDRLGAAGVDIGNREKMEYVGKFARIADCDGNPVELWEPA